MTTEPAETWPTPSRLSSGTLIGLLLVVSTLVVLVLSAAVFLAAKRSEAGLIASVETRLLARLERDGISGLAAEIERLDSNLVPGSENVELALWRLRGNEATLIRESTSGFANAAQPGKTSFNGLRFLVFEVDVSAASQDWAIPMQDAQLRFAIAQPTVEMSRAWRTIFVVCAIYLLFVALGLFQHRMHQRRYRDGVQRINALLDRYSNGETGIRFELDGAVPELMVLGRHLNAVLPKIDTLMADLKNTSAHLAHELKTPLQIIRTDLGRITDDKSRDEQIEIVRSIDRRIDQTNARLQSVMQLFRLQSGSSVAMQDDVDLVESITNAYYDFEDALHAEQRQVELILPETLHVHGNERLIDLMMQNILSNAVQYTPPGGQFRIGLHTLRDEFIFILENTGALPKDFGADAFDRFSRGGGSGNGANAGLGLSLVKAIADKHDFAIQLRPSEFEDGTSSVKITIAGSVVPDAHV